MRYILLLRGVNMMGKNVIKMTEFAQYLTAIGLNNVRYYINSGNLFFDSTENLDNLYPKIHQVLTDKHHLNIDFVLINADDFNAELAKLPDFWNDLNVKKAILFFMPKFDVEGFKNMASHWQLENEWIYIGKTALFWAGNAEKSVYRHQLINAKLLRNLSIRNEKTVRAFVDYL